MFEDKLIRKKIEEAIAKGASEFIDRKSVV